MKKINYTVDIYTDFGSNLAVIYFAGANADTAWEQALSHKDIHAMATDGYMHFIPYDNVSYAFRNVSSETVTAPEDAFCE